MEKDDVWTQTNKIERIHHLDTAMNSPIEQITDFIAQQRALAEKAIKVSLTEWAEVRRLEKCDSLATDILPQALDMLEVAVKALEDARHTIGNSDHCYQLMDDALATIAERTRP